MNNVAANDVAFPRGPEDLHAQGFSEASWAEARRIAQTLLPVVSPVPGSIRLLTSHILDEATKLECIRSTLKLPSYLAAVQHFCASVFPESKFEQQTLTPLRVKELLGFDVCAVILGLLFGYRRLLRAKSMVNIEDLSNQIHTKAELGYHLGHELPELGPAAGMLLGGMRFVAIGLIAADDPQRYLNYRTHLEFKNLSFDLEYEVEQWGFMHTQVMALLTQALGFGYHPSVAFFIGLSPLEIVHENELWASRFRTVASWMEAFEAGRAPQKRVSVRGFTISESDLRKLASVVMQRVHSHTAVYWLDKELM